MSSTYQEHPSWFPWVDPNYDAGLEARALNAFYEHERKMRACTCEFDGGYGDDGSVVKRFGNLTCPVHREEDEQEVP